LAQAVCIDNGLNAACELYRLTFRRPFGNANEQGSAEGICKLGDVATRFFLSVPLQSIAIRRAFRNVPIVDLSFEIKIFGLGRYIEVNRRDKVVSTTDKGWIMSHIFDLSGR
jgi:hypothetical protein